MEQQCPVCKSNHLLPVIELRQIPILANVLWESREAAHAAPRGDVRLVFCQDCGHVFNQEFDPARMDYNARYENSLHFSPRFQQYASTLAHHLVNTYNLHGKSIIEIGSGKGEFLHMLCDMGGNVGTGFDPSYEPDPNERRGSTSFIKDLYSERYSDHRGDLIVSRHVLEHIHKPDDFIHSLRRTIGDNKRTVVFFEVPNLGYILRDTSIWDVIYEHYSYYSAHSLANLFTRFGFNVLDLRDAYEGQFLCIEAVPRDPQRSAPNAPYAVPVSSLEQQVRAFGQSSQKKLDHWRQTLDGLCQQNQRVVIWGAGSKGISFLNMLNVRDEIEFVIDINPRKRNMHVTGSGQKIVPPEFLKEFRPNTIIIMNPIYKQEIAGTLAEMGLDAQILTA